MMMRPRSIQFAKQLGQSDLQNMSDLAGCVHRNVDPAAFQQTPVGAVQVAGFREALL
jgi:hypothetical protein